MNNNKLLIFGVFGVLTIGSLIYFKSKKTNEKKDIKNNGTNLTNNLKNETYKKTILNKITSNNLNQSSLITSPEEVSEIVKEMEKLKSITKQIKENKDKMALYEKMTCEEMAKINCFFPSPCSCQKTTEGKKRRLINELRVYTKDLVYKLGLMGYYEYNGQPEKL